MKSLLVVSAALAVAALGGLAYAGDVESGLKPGDSPGAFNVQDCTGPKKGESLCYRCRYGGRPVVSIFARKVDDNLTDLIKRVDKKVGENEEKKMAAFVVLLTDDPDRDEATLKQIAEQNKIRNVPLTIFDGTAGPPGYKISEDADVTVLMWVKHEVKVNHAFADGELNKQSVKQVAASTGQILK